LYFIFKLQIILLTKGTVKKINPYNKQLQRVIFYYYSK